MSPRVRLILTDVDGCLGAGEARPYDLEVLARVADLNRRSRRGEQVPAVTLCTGRPAAYVDAMLQVIDGHLPALFESGSGLYDPQSYRFAWHPRLAVEARHTMGQVRALIEQQVVDGGVGYIQPGKEISLTLFPLPGYTLADVGQAARQALAGHGLPCTVNVSVTSVDLCLVGMDKGAGVRWLSDETGVPLEEMAGVGDTSSDLSFLTIVGFAAAPHNAVPEVRNRVQYTSPFEYGRGLIDIVEQILAAGGP